MRILVLENEPSSLRGGQEQSLFDVCRGLAARAHEIDLLYTTDGNLLPEYRAFCRRVDRVSAYSVDRARALPSATRLVADVVQAGRPAPDVVYANQYLDSFFARLLAWRFHRPFVCHLRLPPPDIFCAQYRWGMRGPVRLIAISSQTREDYVARGFRRDRIDLVHNGIDVEEWQTPLTRAQARSRLGVDPAAFLILCAGRLHPGKGIDLVIDALALLPLDAQLLIAGREVDDGRAERYEPRLVEQAAALGVEARCRFLGHVPKLAELYRAADVTVLASVISEAFGRTVIESMACGTPVVGSNAGGIPEILTGEFDRYLFPVSDRRALADRLLSLRGWRDRDPGLADRCRTHVARHFDLATTVSGVEASLQRTVDEWRAGAPVSARSEKPCASA